MALRPRPDPVVLTVVVLLLALGGAVVWLSPANRLYDAELASPVDPDAAARRAARAEREAVESPQPTEAPPARGRVVGTVTDEGGEPVRGVTVTAYGDARQGVSYNTSFVRVPWESTTTDAEGRFEIELAPSTYYLGYQARQRRFARVYSGGSAALSAAAEVRVHPEVESVRDMVLLEGAAVEGQVVDGSGSPLTTTAALEVRHGEGWAEVAQERPAPVGARGDAGFRFARVLPGTYRLRVEDRAAGTVRSPRPLRLRGGEVARDVELVVPPPGTVAGRVTDAAGRPVAGMLVRTVEALVSTPLGTSWARGPQARTDGSGRYLLPRVRSGVYQLVVGGRGGRSSCLAPAPHVEVVAGRAAKRDLRLHPQATVAGVVRDGQGRPVPDARVSTVVHGCHHRTRTDASGRYELRLPAERLELFVDPPGERLLGARSALPRLHGGTTRTLDFRLERPGRLVGTVDLARAKAVEKVQVVATRLESGRFADTYVGSVRRNGSYELGRLVPGRYRIAFNLLGDQWVNNDWRVERAFLTGSGISPFRSEAVEVAVRGGVATTVPPASGDVSATISGTVTDADGEAQAEVAVTVHRQHARRWRVVGSRMTDAAGHYTYPGLQAGIYRLSFRREFGGLETGYHPDASRLADAADLEVGSGETVDGVDIVLDTSFE